MNDQIFDLIRSHENDKIESFLIDLDYQYINSRGETLFDCVIISNNLVAMKMLIQYNIKNKITFDNKHPYTLNCLYYAIEKLNLPMIYFMINTYYRKSNCLTKMIVDIIKNKLNLDGDINEIDQWDRTPIFYSTSAKMTKLLIQYGCNVNVKDFEDNTLLHVANINTIDVLVKYINTISLNKRNETPFSSCYRRGEYDVCKILIKSNLYNNTDIYDIIMNTNIDLIKCLLESILANNDISMHILIRFYLSVINRKIDEIKIFLNLNVHKMKLLDINPIFLTNDNDVIELLKQYDIYDDIDIDFDIDNNTPLPVPDCIQKLNFNQK